MSIKDDIVRTVNVVAGHSCIPATRIMGKRRTKTIAHMRQIVYYLLHEQGYSYNSIGKHLGKDHATIMHGVKKIAEGRKMSSVMNTFLKQLEKDL